MRNKLFKKKKWLVGIIAIVLLGGGITYAAFFRTSAPQTPPIKVTRGSITQEVVVTGKTKPVESVDLAFERTGTVAEADVKVGDMVRPGDVLARVDTRELQASFREMQANVDAAQAKLTQLKQGTRPEDIQVTRTELAQANQDLSNEYLEIVPLLGDSYAKADDALRNQVDQLFINTETVYPKLSFVIVDSQLQTDIEALRLSVGKELTQWKTELGALSAGSSPDDLDAALMNSETRLGHMTLFFSKISDALANTISLPAGTLTTYKTSVNNARTSVNAALTNVSSKKQSISSQEIAVKKIQDELSLDLAGTVPEEIQAQAAVVAQAQAQLDSITIQISKSTLRSPIAGVVTRQDAKTGQIAAVNTVLVSVISQNNLEIEANVPEVDIGRVSIKNPVHITLDALPGEQFNGVVTYIDPAETVVDGVVNFKVKINFNAPDTRIKSGLTANLNIETQKKDGVLILPQFAILENDNGTFVKKIENGASVQIPITIGIRSNDGNVEILSGVSEGDEVANIGAKTQ